MRRHDFFTETEPRSEQSAKNKCRPAGRHVHHCAARKIDRRNFRARIPNAVHESVDPPDHVGERKINDEHPNADEDKDGGESDSFGDRADNQSRRDDCKHQLIHRENVLRNPKGVIAVGLRVDSAKKCKLQPADERRTARKNERIADGPPKNCHQSRDAETLRQDREHIFLPNQPTVKQRQSGKRHK